MLKRTITGAVLVIMFVAALLLFNTIYLNLIFSLISVLAVYEMSFCLKLEKKLLLVFPAYILAFAFPLMAYYFKITTFLFFSAALYLYMFFLFAVTTFSRGKISLDSTAMLFFTMAYILLGFNCWLMLKYLHNGIYLFVLAVLGAVATDVAAYFIGCAFGKHKLIEDVSPKKTIEGACGGVIVCALSCVGYGAVVGAIFQVTPKYIPLLILGIIISIISQIGDLIASLIKRHFGIKDYGKILPGHGGIMDRFDSVIAIAPFIFIFCFNQLFFGDLFHLFL